MQKNSIFFLSGLFVFLLFILFSYFVHKNLFVGLDFNTTVRLQDHISRRFDELFSLFSDLGKVEIMTVILIAIFFISKRLQAGIVAICLYIGFHLIELYGKFFVNHPPPPQFMLRTKQIISMPQFNVRTVNSYPSGHAGRTFFIATILVILLISSRRFTPLIKAIFIGIILSFAFTMLVSRVYLGEHWTSDIIGGSILGTSLGLLNGGLLVGKNKKHS